MKNILIITGSPRAIGNSNRLAQAFREGASAKGHKVVMFDAGSKKILPCIACEKCWSNGKPCVFDDDSLELEQYIFDTDVIVFVSPVYWFSFTSQIKLVMDKLYPYIEKKSHRPLKIIDSYLLGCAHDSEEHVFDGMIATYQNIVSYMKWHDSGQILTSGVGQIGDIEGNDVLEEAYHLGYNI